jgi:hypothetical protein
MLSLRELGLDTQRDNINIQAIGDSTVIAQSLATGIIDAAALDKLQSLRLLGLGGRYFERSLKEIQWNLTSLSIRSSLKSSSPD